MAQTSYGGSFKENQNKKKFRAVLIIANCKGYDDCAMTDVFSDCLPKSRIEKNRLLLRRLRMVRNLFCDAYSLKNERSRKILCSDALFFGFVRHKGCDRGQWTAERPLLTHAFHPSSSRPFSRNSTDFLSCPKVKMYIITFGQYRQRAVARWTIITHSRKKFQVAIKWQFPLFRTFCFLYRRSRLADAF